MSLNHKYRGHFEVHLTIRAGDSLEAFRGWCDAERCKCVYIVLACGLHTEQPMATWRRSGSELNHILEESTERANRLARAGFAVIRLKIEVDPSNEDVPATDESALLHPHSNYFEHHVKLLRHAETDRELLLRICHVHSAHLSRNAWRKASEGIEERFVTLRSHRVGLATTQQRLRSLLADLERIGEKVISVESEYTVYDSNLELDAGWLPHDTA